MQATTSILPDFDNSPENIQTGEVYVAADHQRADEQLGLEQFGAVPDLR